MKTFSFLQLAAAAVALSISSHSNTTVKDHPDRSRGRSKSSTVLPEGTSGPSPANYNPTSRKSDVSSARTAEDDSRFEVEILGKRDHAPKAERIEKRYLISMNKIEPAWVPVFKVTGLRYRCGYPIEGYPYEFWKFPGRRKPHDFRCWWDFHIQVDGRDDSAYMAMVLPSHCTNRGYDRNDHYKSSSVGDRLKKRQKTRFYPCQRYKEHTERPTTWDGDWFYSVSAYIEDPAIGKGVPQEEYLHLQYELTPVSSGMKATAEIYNGTITVLRFAEVQLQNFVVPMEKIETAKDVADPASYRMDKTYYFKEGVEHSETLKYPD